MTHWATLNYVVVDVEGNGRQPPDLVELAAVPVVDGVIGEAKSWLIRPDQPITYFARKVHGVTNDQVAEAPVFAYIEADVLKALDASALVAHNAHVDVGVLQRKLGDWECPEVFDTLKLARRLLPGRKTYKLGALVEEFGLAQGLGGEDQPHRAKYDARPGRPPRPACPAQGCRRLESSSTLPVGGRSAVRTVPASWPPDGVVNPPGGGPRRRGWPLAGVGERWQRGGHGRRDRAGRGQGVHRRG
jgi:hypothetical protein